jgi:hypothetical protein
MLLRLLPGLLQIRAVAGAIERYFPLFAAALRTDFAVDSGTKPFLLPLLADGAAQRCSSSISIISRKAGLTAATRTRIGTKLHYS